jgi:hypothetical protein
MCSQTFAKNDKSVHSKCIKSTPWCTTGFISAHKSSFVIGYEEYVQEAYHPNGLPEYDKAVDFQRFISYFILTILGNLFRENYKILKILIY